MKRTLTLLFSLCVALLLFGCAGSEEPSGEAGTPSFNATVLEVYESGGCLVEPFADEEAASNTTARSSRPIRHSLRQCIPCVVWMKTERVRRAVGLRIEPAGAAGHSLHKQKHQPF